MPYCVCSKSKTWEAVESVSYKNGDREITRREIDNYVETHGLENGSYFNINIEDIADEILSPDNETTTTVVSTETVSVQTPADDNAEETAPSVQQQADNTNEETVFRGNGKAAIEELIKKFLTKDLMEELITKAETLKSTPLDSLKKELIKVLCKHIEPTMIPGSMNDDKVKRWSVEDMSTILSMDMLSEFCKTPNIKKKAAIEAAIDKYGKATMITYGLLITNITTQLAIGLYI